MAGCNEVTIAIIVISKSKYFFFLSFIIRDPLQKQDQFSVVLVLSVH